MTKVQANNYTLFVIVNQLCASIGVKVHIVQLGYYCIIEKYNSATWATTVQAPLFDATQSKSSQGTRSKKF